MKLIRMSLLIVILTATTIIPNFAFAEINRISCRLDSTKFAVVLYPDADGYLSGGLEIDNIYGHQDDNSILDIHAANNKNIWGQYSQAHKSIIAYFVGKDGSTAKIKAITSKENKIKGQLTLTISEDTLNKANEARRAGLHSFENVPVTCKIVLQ